MLYHEPDRRPAASTSAARGEPGYASRQAAKGRAEMAGDDIRLTYVALTRAQSQVVAWWAPSWDEVNGGLSRLLRGRGIGERACPTAAARPPSDADALRLFGDWQAAGGPVVEESVSDRSLESNTRLRRQRSRARHFHRMIDAAWRRTSYSGLIRAVDAPGGLQRAGDGRQGRRGARWSLSRY